jgi:dsRNA-specific ribonuclease
MNTMTAKGTSAVQDNLVKVFEKLEAARKMQDGWMNHGLDFVDLYVEDVGGDWLEKWGKQANLEFDTIRSVDVDAVKVAIGFPNFQKRKLLEIALTHRCDTNDSRFASFESSVGHVKYKRLALLGSAIFSAVVTDYLYRKYPRLDRDCISILKSRLVDKKKLSEFAISLNLQAITGRGANGKQTDKSEYKRFMGETFEAVFGAIYLECDRDFNPAGEWLIQRFIEQAVSQNISQKSYLIESPQISPESAVKRRGSLGADILDAIAIDYLYHRFPSHNASQLTDWKNILVSQDIFPKDFQVKLGSQYLELGSNFSRTRDWLVDNFIKTTVEELLEETGNQLK